MRACIIFTLLFVVSLATFAENRVIVLSYHDVKDKLAGDLNQDQLAVSTEQLVQQFSWLRAHGYKMISLDDLLEARAGRINLPDRSVLLTFDDGYESFYSRVFPLLQLYQYPAIVAVVGKWLEVPKDGTVDYGDVAKLPRSRFLSWQQIREMVKSGLVEVASHSYDLHHGVIGNPQGNFEPAAVTRIYNKDLATYEDDRHYENRIRNDLKRNNEIIFEQTGSKTRAIVWPYGAYSGKTVAIAKALGMPVTMGLGEGDNTLADLSQMSRMLVEANPTLERFVYEIRHLVPTDPRRVVHVDLDYIYDPSAEQTNENLGRLLDRIKAMHINTVFLQAFADPDGDGNADALYFPNRSLPMRADLFNRVAWQLKTRTEVGVYAWMPVLAFKIDAPDTWKVHHWQKGQAKVSDRDYHRLSPFHPEVRRVVGAIYEDLAKYADFQGLLFHDDAFLDENEDLNSYALKQAQQQWNLPDNYDQIVSDKDHRTTWMQAKSKALIDFTGYLTAIVREYRPEVKTARNLYASLVLNPKSQRWFAQSLPAFIESYDYTAVMAMPKMEQAEDPENWLLNLVAAVKKYPGAIEKTIFELQSVDWNQNKKIPSEVLVRQMNLLQQNGAIQFGYYPDDVFDNHPKLADMQRSISLQTFPFGP